MNQRKMYFDQIVLLRFKFQLLYNFAYIRYIHKEGQLGK